MDKRKVLTRVLLLLFCLSVFPSRQAGAGIQAHTTAQNLQVWTINIQHFGAVGGRPYRDAWRGVVRRMSLAQFKPDIIMIQEISYENGEIFTFWDEVLDTIGTQYNFIHGDDDNYDPARAIANGGNAIIYNTGRLAKRGVDVWKRHESSSGCSQTGGGQLGVTFLDRYQNKKVAVGSIHTSGTCVEQNAMTTAAKLDNLEPVRPLTIIGGDFNQRPDKHDETAVSGLETDPDCWYRRFSAAHANATLSGTSCGNPTSVYDRYYDTVWLKAGGAINPAVPELCEQFTRVEEFGSLDPDLHDAANSCTDIVVNSSSAANPEPGPDNPPKLDKSRIDYLWVGWETAQGAAERPGPQIAAARVAHASADLGLDPNPDLYPLENYSDHRAVEALLVWPPATE